MDLTEALELREREVVALVGGGGKTTTMFRLCAEAVARGRKAVASGTARFSDPDAAISLPVFLDEDEGRLIEALRAGLRTSPAVIASTARFSQGRYMPISYETVGRLANDPSVGLVVLEADGSRTRPFKAPAEHEPAVPPSATFVLAIVGADVFGQPLSQESVHRLDQVVALSGAEEGDPITPALVARVLAAPSGGRKSVPPAARFAVLINKVTADRLAAAQETGRLLLAHGVPLVVIGSAQEEPPVVDLMRL